MIKSPFIIIEDFVSPLVCEDIISNIDWGESNKTYKNSPMVIKRSNDIYEDLIIEKLEDYYSKIDNHYNTKIKEFGDLSFEMYSEGYRHEDQPKQLKFNSENSSYIRNKWVRTNDNDFTAILFLSDFNDTPQFDEEYEVYGGKLEFFQHRFGFNPKRGTLIIFPSSPYFINHTSNVIIGDMFQVRMHLTTEQQFIYTPINFPGDMAKWFK